MEFNVASENKLTLSFSPEICVKRKEALANAREFDSLLTELQNPGHLFQNDTISEYIQKLRRIEYLSGYLAENYSALRTKV